MAKTHARPSASAQRRESSERGLTLGGFLLTSARRLRPYAVPTLLVLLAMLVQAAFRVAVPIAYQQIFDRAILTRNMEVLTQILGLLLAGWTAQAVASLLQDHFSAKSGYLAMSDLRTEMFDHLLRLPVGYYSQVDSGDLMSRFSNDLAVIETALVRAIHTFVFSALMLVTSLILLFVVEWRLALMTLAALPIALFGPKLLSGRAQWLSYQCKKTEAKIAASIREAISSHAVIRTFGIQASRIEAFKKQLGGLVRIATQARFAASLAGRAASQSVFLVQILTMAVGAYLAIHGVFTVGSLVAFVALLLNVSNAANHLSAVMPDLLQASGGMQRVQDFLAEEPTVRDRQGCPPLPRLADRICFEDVSFGYRQSAPALQDVSFTVTAGESVAVVGPSGSGKSTILNLILRLYDPDRGRVTLDGIDLRDCSESSLRAQTGVVLQDSVLFDASLLENLRIGRPEAGESEVRRAAYQAEIHDLIMSMPRRYHTRVGEGGSHLSGGERQRIAIARALLNDPALLILDEPTSALDPATAAAINATLRRVGRDRTVFFTTHRLGSIHHMNRILVVEDGRIVEQGRHQDLLEREGPYHRLWQKQSGFTVSADGHSAQVSPHRLKAIPLLAGLDPQRLQAIADLLVSESYPADRIVYSKGESGDRFFLIVRGEVEQMLSPDGGRGGGVRKLADGDYFGAQALLEATPRQTTIQTAAPTLLLSLRRRQFELLLEGEPELRAAIEREAAYRRVEQHNNFETMIAKMTQTLIRTEP
ncbi:MAG: ABC transporter transmembrane domain-containing protein [Acidobacteriota bacterium]